ncbi:MAG: NAD+ synthase [Acidobacteria bacterium]|nr:MAG: NAD+ synthase [Acidobacteriota bacterium]
MKIALAQTNTTVGDFNGNVERIVKFARCARERGADLVVFPELALCGYPPRDLVEKPSFIARSEAELDRLAQLLPDIRALVGYVRRSGAEQGKQASDAAALLYRGKRVLDYSKILLAFYDVFDESRYFEPGNSAGLYAIEGWQLGVTICEDAWNDKNFWKKQLYTRDPVEEAVRAGAKLLLNIASSPFTSGKIRLRHDMLKAIAIERQVPVVYVNQVGGNDQLVFDGSSMAFNARGELCARAKSFEEDLVIFDAADGLGPKGEVEVRPGPASDVEAIYQALLLGLRDYVSKCGFAKVIVGLSGGIDSSLVVTLAADALGPENVLGVSMPGPYSSSASFRDAETLARNLGIDFRAIPIRSIFEDYLVTLDPAFEDRPRDATEENIQARIRGNILMALSNKFRSLVLSTGNKSELAVGYCTLYGDMAGGLAVIADVPKTMVYDLARYANRASERIPAACLEKAPSAELRPNQTDQDTLPPYDVLDVILRAYIEENLCAEEIIEKFRLDSELVEQTVRRVNSAEYKRQQAAPALKVTAKAFGTGRRYPIANKFSE